VTLVRSGELPPAALCTAAHVLAFDGDALLMVDVRGADRGWNPPGGHILPGERPHEAALREVAEEACAAVCDLVPFAHDRIELAGDPPAAYPYPCPVSYQVCFVAPVERLEAFRPSEEVAARRLFPPAEARELRWIEEHRQLYEAALATRELPLTGGRVTEGVVRLGDTVRRPLQPNAALVRAVLRELEERGFEDAPRWLGADEKGRETYSFVEGAVPPDLDPAFPDATLAAAARLLRRYHDLTVPLAAGREVVAHGDTSPCNFVFRDGMPVALIDFDAAAPGDRLQDVANALFLWLVLGHPALAAAEQARRIGIVCAAYGIEHDAAVVDATIAWVRSMIPRLGAEHQPWWRGQLAWIEHHRDDLSSP
jgi:ADP-ribose pyrophosphatase YjhB (NUDIX family)